MRVVVETESLSAISLHDIAPTKMCRKSIMVTRLHRVVIASPE